MNQNDLFNEVAKAIQDILSDARNTGIVTDDGAEKIAEAMLIVAVLASVPTPVPHACRLARSAADGLADEMASCVHFRDIAPVQWSYAASTALQSLHASADIAMAEIVAQRIGFYLEFDKYDLEVKVGPMSSRGKEPSYKAFYVLDSKELLGFLQDCEESALAQHESAPH